MTEKMISRADVEKLLCEFAEGSFTAQGWNHAIEAVLSLEASAHAEPVAGTPITMTYRNYRGEVDQRTVVPTHIWFGSTDWHPEPGWLMAAYDLAKAAHRDFALADCQFAALTPLPDAELALTIGRGEALADHHGGAVAVVTRELIAALRARPAGVTVEMIDLACNAVEDYCSDMPDLAGHGHSVGLKDAIRAALTPNTAQEDRPHGR